MSLPTQLPASARARVALCRGSQRAGNLRDALERVIDEVDWVACRRVLVKPNLVASFSRVAITHRDALETVLQAVRQRYSGDLLVAEGCAVESTLAVMKKRGYPEVAARYDARMLDLNGDETEPATVYTAEGRPITVRLARSVLESDCRISLAIPKTHDMVQVTLGIKNMIMGSVVNPMALGGEGGLAWHEKLGQMVRQRERGWGSDKRAMHQGYPMINVNLALLAGRVWPHLTVLDGFVAMEGNGPVGGSAAPWGVAMAGADALAVDALAAELMGFPAQEVGYLHYCTRMGLGRAGRDEMEVVGNVEPDQVRRALAPHKRHALQRQWQHPRARELLGL